MPNQTANPAIITVLAKCVADFRSQAKEYLNAVGRDLGDLAYLATEDAKYNLKCLNNYKRSGDFDKLIKELRYQDTLPREKVFWALMQAGHYPTKQEQLDIEFYC
jgi:hypothetical protein